MWPLVEELLKLAKGVAAWDCDEKELFVLRAYLIVVFGDIPAVSMMMRVKGQNGFSPCRMCKIKGVLGGKTYYIPLERSQHPSVLRDKDAIKKYDPASLPLRTHEDFIAQAREVQFANTGTAAEQLSMRYGINGMSIFFNLSSLSFPKSFPYDFMHLLYENVFDNLILLWTGAFKGLDTGSGDYELGPDVWEAIGEATAASGSTIPSAFGARPPNIAKDKKAKTAETKSFWLLYLGPVLLRRRFTRPIYYTHFVELIKLVTLCLQFEISRDELKTIRTGFQTWVTEYER
jgi:hypothetical protein